MQRKCTSVLCTCDFTENCTLKKASAQHIRTSLSVNTEVMARSHHRHLLRYCSYHPLCPPKPANKAFHQTCWPAWKCEFEPWFVSLALLGWCPGRESRRTIPGRGEGLPTALKKKQPDHSSSSCTSPSPSLVPQKKPAAPPPPPTVVLTVLRIWNNTCHLQFHWSSVSLLALPAPRHKTSWYLHSILRKKLDLLQHREVWNMS